MDSWDFADDEWVFFFVTLIFSVTATIHWYLTLARFGSRFRARPWTLLLLPVLLLASLAAVLWRWADPNYVAGHFDYLILFLVGGAAWFFLAASMLLLLGISWRDDAIERGNPATLIALSAGLTGIIITYAGGNIGAGPTIWTTLVPAAMASGTLFLLWHLLNIITRQFDAIAIDRDQATAWRLAGWAVASSFVLARAVASDWISWGQTVADFLRLSWPCLLFVAGLIALHSYNRPTPQQPKPPVGRVGLLPGLIMVFLAILYVLILPKPEIGKHVITYEQHMQSK